MCDINIGDDTFRKICLDVIASRAVRSNGHNPKMTLIKETPGRLIDEYSCEKYQ